MGDQLGSLVGIIERLIDALERAQIAYAFGGAIAYSAWARDVGEGASIRGKRRKLTGERTHDLGARLERVAIPSGKTTGNGRKLSSRETSHWHARFWNMPGRDGQPCPHETRVEKPAPRRYYSGRDVDATPGCNARPVPERHLALRRAFQNGRTTQ